MHIYEEGKEGYRETDCKKWKSKLKDTNKLEMAGNVVFVYDVGRDGNRFILKEMQILDIQIAERIEKLPFFRRGFFCIGTGRSVHLKERDNYVVKDFG